MSKPKDGHGNDALAEGRKLESKQDDLLTKTDPGIAVPGQQGKDHAGIGGRYFDVTPDESARIFEKKNQILQAAAQGGQGYDGWTANVTDADAKRLIRQEQRLADKQYEDWLAANFVRDMDSPSDQAWAQRTFPAYFEKRKKVIEDYTEIQKKIAMMELTGPQNEEDLKLLYMWNAGLIEIPKEAVHMMKREDDSENQFIRGRFNVRRLAINPATDKLSSRGAPQMVRPSNVNQTGPFRKNWDLDNVSWMSNEQSGIIGM